MGSPKPVVGRDCPVCGATLDATADASRARCTACGVSSASPRDWRAPVENLLPEARAHPALAPAAKPEGYASE